MALVRRGRAHFPALLRLASRFSTTDSITTTSAVQVGEIGEVSGVPSKHLHRKVVIYRPAKSASQQGRANTEKWKIRFDSTDKWENPLMGWTSTGDPLSSVGDSSLYFLDKEAAVDFAKKYGWEYSVSEPHEVKERVKVYADNFKWKGPPVEEM